MTVGIMFYAAMTGLVVGSIAAVVSSRRPFLSVLGISMTWWLFTALVVAGLLMVFSDQVRIYP